MILHVLTAQRPLCFSVCMSKSVRRWLRLYRYFSSLYRVRDDLSAVKRTAIFAHDVLLGWGFITYGLMAWKAFLLTAQPWRILSVSVDLCTGRRRNSRRGNRGYCLTTAQLKAGRPWLLPLWSIHPINRFL